MKRLGVDLGRWGWMGVDGGKMGGGNIEGRPTPLGGALYKWGRGKAGYKNSKYS